MGTAELNAGSKPPRGRGVEIQCTLSFHATETAISSGFMLAHMQTLPLFYLLQLARRTLGSTLGPCDSYAIIRENFRNLQVKVQDQNIFPKNTRKENLIWREIY